MGEYALLEIPLLKLYSWFILAPFCFAHDVFRLTGVRAWVRQSIYAIRAGRMRRIGGVPTNTHITVVCHYLVHGLLTPRSFLGKPRRRSIIQHI